MRNDDEPLPPSPDLVEVTVTVENLSPEQGTALTPLWVGFHDGDFDTYDRNRPASAGLESLAEDGDTTLFSEEFLNSGAGFVEDVIVGDGGANPGVIDVGETTSFTFTVDRSLASSRYLNYAAMVLPSNDGFIANGDPIAHEIFDQDGNFLGADFTVAGNEVLDAGTEVNDEAENSTAFFSQAEPNTGEIENGLVTTHPGFDPDGRILSSSDFTNADFTAEDYQIARITVTADGFEPEAPEDDDVEVYRFFNNDLQLEFYTANEFERDYLVENFPQYQLQGVSFIAADEPVEGEDISGVDPVYRFFNTSTGVHLYTTSDIEKDAAIENSNYSFEGIAYYGYESEQEGTVPLYRFYNESLDAHFYTPSSETKDIYLESPDYQPEGENGIAFYVEPAEI
ncbi:spondin domain-containing protein [Waterburya agarophytonicola K14]|uniref:Spondin domain-containing protein n=1 Tax=Waterburya agarophytonicola KI4 TaxID=2874699 RepID=A0A964BV30_9CYAN|nr:spondin domain-containing protein [Waterburya agarophytonicola KI4]